MHSVPATARRMAVAIVHVLSPALHRALGAGGHAKALPRVSLRERDRRNLVREACSSLVHMCASSESHPCDPRCRHGRAPRSQPSCAYMTTTWTWSWTGHGRMNHMLGQS